MEGGGRGVYESGEGGGREVRFKLSFVRGFIWLGTAFLNVIFYLCLRIENNINYLNLRKFMKIHNFMFHD